MEMHLFSRTLPLAAYNATEILLLYCNQGQISTWFVLAWTYFLQEVFKFDIYFRQHIKSSNFEILNFGKDWFYGDNNKYINRADCWRKCSLLFYFNSNVSTVTAVLWLSNCFCSFLVYLFLGNYQTTKIFILKILNLLNNQVTKLFLFL